MLEAHAAVEPRALGATFMVGLRLKRLDLCTPLASHGHFVGRTLQRCVEEYGGVDPDEQHARDLDALDPSRGNPWMVDRPDHALNELRAFQSWEPQVAQPTDVKLLAGLLDGIRRLPATGRLGDLLRALGRLPGNRQFRIGVGEVLGYAGVLAPGAERDLPNDWSGPVSSWLASDGVNEEAVARYFPGLEKKTRKRARR